MRQNDIGRVVAHGQLGDPAVGELDRIGIAGIDAVGTDLPQVVIQTEEKQRLLRQAAAGGDQLFAVVAHQILPLGVVGRRGDGLRKIAPGHIRNEVQMHRRMQGDALHLRQLFRRSAEDAHQRAEMFQQPMCQHVGIAAGNRIKQQQFQDIMRFKAFQSFGEIAALEPFPVTLVLV